MFASPSTTGYRFQRAEPILFNRAYVQLGQDSPYPFAVAVQPDQSERGSDSAWKDPLGAGLFAIATPAGYETRQRDGAYLESQLKYTLIL